MKVFFSNGRRQIIILSINVFGIISCQLRTRKCEQFVYLEEFCLTSRKNHTFTVLYAAMATASEFFGLTVFVLWMFEAITPLHHNIGHRVSEEVCYCEETNDASTMRLVALQSFRGQINKGRSLCSHTVFMTCSLLSPCQEQCHKMTF